MNQKGAKREKKRGKKSRRASERAPLASAASVATTNTTASAALALDRESEVEVDLTELASRVPEPPPFQPATRTQSGYAPRMRETPRVDDETLSDHLVSLQPLYRETDGKHDERAAELELVDPSLRLEGSFLGSPLTSMPPVRSRPLAARIGRAVSVVLIAASSGYGVWSAVRDLRASVAPERARVERVEVQPVRAVAIAAPLPAPHVIEQARPVAVLDEPAPVAQAAALAPILAVEPTEPSEPARQKPSRARKLIDLKLADSSMAAPAAPSVADAVPPPQLPASAAIAPVAGEAVAPTAAAPVSAGALPKRPSPSDVRASFRQVQPALRACAGGRQGMVTIRAFVAGSGRINSGTVEGDFQSPDERACMTRAILELRLPPFEQDVFEIAYPLAL